MTEEKRIYYLKRLNHPEMQERKQAIQNLGVVDDPHIFKILSGHFADSHPEIRDVLFRVFTRNQNRRIAEIVADTLHSPQLSVRSLAMEILRTMNVESVLPLRRLCKSVKPEIRKIAVELLGDIKDAAAAGLLLEMLSDDVDMVKIAVIEALGKHQEIRAVPQLLALYQEEKSQQAVILNTLTRIFLHWEKKVIHPDQLEADPALAFSLINSVQENGNVSALNLMLDWLKKDVHDINDEILKALSVILRKNEYITLPSQIFPVILKIWDQFSKNLSSEVLFTCLERIPNTDAFEFILERCEQEVKNPQILAVARRYICRFPAVFFALYDAIPEKLRLTLLSDLCEENAKIHDQQLTRLYAKSDTENEKRLLLKLAIAAELPEAKNICFSRLGEAATADLPGILADLRKFYDPSLWKLFYDYSRHSDERVRNEAVQGMLQYPEKTADYLQEDHPSEERKNLEREFASVLETLKNNGSRELSLQFLKQGTDNDNSLKNGRPLDRLGKNGDNSQNEWKESYPAKPGVKSVKVN